MTEELNHTIAERLTWDEKLFALDDALKPLVHLMHSEVL